MYYVFGHRHQPILLPMHEGKSFYVCLGDWLNFCTYLKVDGSSVPRLESFPFK
jgi:UDP-2,3-diacylglucosamine pyrophosphatase LpxH